MFKKLPAYAFVISLIQVITKAYAGSKHMLISLSEIVIKYITVATSC